MLQEYLERFLKDKMSQQAPFVNLCLALGKQILMHPSLRNR